MSEERRVRFFIAKHLSLRGREVKADLPASFDFGFGWIADRPCSTENLILRSKLDKPVDDPPKSEVKVGRGVQENTRQYREAKETNVICLVF